MPVCVLSVLTAKVAEECLDKVCAGSWSISEKQFFSVAVRPTPEAPAERSGRSRRVSVLCECAQKCQEFGADSLRGHDAVVRPQLAWMEREGGGTQMGRVAP